MTLVPASSHGSSGPLTELDVTSTHPGSDFADLEIVNASDVEVRKTSTAGSGFQRFNQDGAAFIYAKVTGDNPGNIIRVREYDVLFYTNAGGSHILKTSRENDGLGFFGVAPTVQPVASDIAAALAALGLVAAGSRGATLSGGVKTTAITSGALPTVAPVSATAFQCSTTRDVFLTVPVTYNPGVATTATCKVELSPDNVTFSELVTVTQPVGTVFDGSIEAVQLVVPAAWRVKLTVVNATLGTGTYY